MVVTHGSGYHQLSYLIELLRQLTEPRPGSIDKALDGVDQIRITRIAKIKSSGAQCLNSETKFPNRPARPWSNSGSTRKVVNLFQSSFKRYVAYRRVDRLR